VSGGLEIDWVVVEPGSTTIGSDNRSVLFGAPGPKHEVRIEYPFKISRMPVDAVLAARLIEAGEVEIASEGEWEMAHAAGSLDGGEGIEVLADRTAHGYWGKVCDGRPFIAGRASVAIGRDWSDGSPRLRVIEIAESSSLATRLVKRSPAAYSSDNPTLPIGPDRFRMAREEAVIWSALGIAPSFLWAWWNASPGYIVDGWLNLVLGGCFLGAFSGIIWRPRTPSYRVSQDGSRIEIDRSC